MTANVLTKSGENAFHGFHECLSSHAKAETFGEWDAFYPSGNVEPGSGARRYPVGGVVFFATKDFAVDLRAGTGLNAQANRFLVGTGLAFQH